jgi:nucleoside-diphosphate-sugar epimerase
MVTGGTGFVGAHSVAALVDAGHDVRLLVRDASRIGAVLRPLGVGPVDHVVGDMTDPRAVDQALDGCDAVLHAAGVVAIDRRRAELLDVNPRGTQIVIDAAVARRLDPIVHVSSVSALFTPAVDRVHAELLPAPATSAYGRSKAAAETIVRRHQAAGAPVVCTYPGGVVGPPAGIAFGEMASAIVSTLRAGIIPTPDGAISIVDVRDVARVHAAVMGPGTGPARYVCGGRFLPLTEYAALYRQITGRRFPVVPLPGAALRATGRLVDALARVLPIDTVFTGDAMETLTRWRPTDDEPVADALGIRWRDPAETLSDAVRGLRAAGRVSARQAGRLA